MKQESRTPNDSPKQIKSFTHLVAWQKGHTLLLVVTFLILTSFFSIPNAAHAGLVLDAPVYAGLNNGLVGYWSFNGPDIAQNASGAITAYDRSGQNNHGSSTVVVNAPKRTTGKIGQAFDFDGVNDRIYLNGFGWSDSSFTISLWINVEKWVIQPASPDGFIDFVLLGDDATDDQIEFRADNVSGPEEISFIYWDGATEYGIVNGTLPGTNGWHHIAGTFNNISGGWKYYLDGIVNSSITSDVTTNISTGPDNMVGAFGDKSADTISRFFDGLIDDVRIYNRALSPQEIKRLYNIGGTLKIGKSLSTGSLAQGLVGYWSFDGTDVADAIAFDRSGQGNNGILTNGPRRTIGKIAQGLQFDGVDDYVLTSSTINVPGEMSAFMWVWFDALNNDAFPNYLLAQCCGVPSSQFGFQEDQGGFGGQQNGIYWNNTLVHGLSERFSIGRWYYLGFIRTGSSGNWTSRFYLDGQLKETQTGIATNPAGADNVYIGTLQDAEYKFPGKIDDVRIYNRALSPQEIKRLYNIGGTLKINKSLSTGNLQQGLVGWWTFDGPDMAQNGNSIKVYDKSGNNNTASSSGDIIPKKTIGKIGQAFDFDPVNDYVSVANPTNMPTGDFTISVWDFPTKTTGYLVTSRGTGTTPRGFELDISDFDKVILHTFGANTAADIVSVLTVKKNEWNHVAATRSGSALRVYVNGVMDANTGSDAVALNYGSCPLFIGADTDNDADCTITNGGYSNGRIDDVRIYNRALTPDEIKRLYLMGGGR